MIVLCELHNTDYMFENMSILMSEYQSVKLLKVKTHKIVRGFMRFYILYNSNSWPNIDFVEVLFWQHISVLIQEHSVPCENI